MAFVPPPLPPEFLKDQADQQRWQREVLSYAKAAGMDGLRCARRNDAARKDGSKTYFMVREGSTVRPHLRTIMPTQLVFDLGDLVAGDPPDGDWGRCQREADAISQACYCLGIPFVFSLSSGKGVHIEIFLDPAGPQSRCRDEGEDWRKFIAYRILAEAKRILWPDEDERAERHIVYDMRCIDPREGSRLLTDNGERKSPGSPHRKVVWHAGFGPAPPLPATREEAYRIAEANGIVRPSTIPIAADAGRHDTRWTMELFEKPCPVGPKCFEANDGWPVCDDCPALGAD